MTALGQGRPTRFCYHENANTNPLQLSVRDTGSPSTDVINAVPFGVGTEKLSIPSSLPIYVA